VAEVINATFTLEKMTWLSRVPHCTASNLSQVLNPRSQPLPLYLSTTRFSLQQV